MFIIILKAVECINYIILLVFYYQTWSLDAFKKTDRFAAVISNKETITDAVDIVVSIADTDHSYVEILLMKISVIQNRTKIT